MLTGFVLTSVAVGGVSVMTAPQFFRARSISATLCRPRRAAKRAIRPLLPRHAGWSSGNVWHPPQVGLAG